MTELSESEYAEAFVKRVLRGERKARELQREVNSDAGAEADAPDPAAEHDRLRDTYGTAG